MALVRWQTLIGVMSVKEAVKSRSIKEKRLSFGMSRKKRLLIVCLS